MFYLISEQELIDLQTENSFQQVEIVKKLTKPEKIALITWSGEDVINYIKKHANCSKSIIGDVIRDVKKALENCDCAMCFGCAMEAILKERGCYRE